MITRWHAALIVTLSFLAIVWCASSLFDYVESTRGYEDFRHDQVTVIFTVILGATWLVSLVALLRRDKESPRR